MPCVVFFNPLAPKEFFCHAGGGRLILSKIHLASQARVIRQIFPFLFRLFCRLRSWLCKSYPEYKQPVSLKNKNKAKQENPVMLLNNIYTSVTRILFIRIKEALPGTVLLSFKMFSAFKPVHLNTLRMACKLWQHFPELLQSLAQDLSVLCATSTRIPPFRPPLNTQGPLRIQSWHF